MKHRMDAFAEIEKQDYTYDLSGNIVIVKKPNLPSDTLVPGFDLAVTKEEPKKTRIKSAANK